jgi:ABC-type glycerol-3-phosphate transport system substrate-binding protein
MDSDPDFHREEYYTNIFDEMEWNGKLYVFPTDIYTDAMMVNRPILDALGVNISDYDGVSTQQLLDWYNQAIDENILASESYELAFREALQKDDDRRYINFTYPKNTLRNYEKYKNDQFYFSNVTHRYGLRYLFSEVFKDAIDTETGEAHFDSQEMIHFLKSIVNVPVKWDGKWAADADYTVYPNEFCNQTSISISKYGPVSLRPYDTVTTLPLVDSQGKKIFGSRSYSIPSTCQNIPLAWAFIKFLAEDKQLDDAKISAQPTNPEFWGIDYDYMMSIPINKNNSRALIQFYPDIAVYMEEIVAWASSVSSCYWYDGELSYALEEIVDRYYNGLIDVEQCAKEMNERVRMYLLE